MRKPHHRSPFLGAFTLLLVSSLDSSAAPTASHPVGCLTYPVPSETITSFGVPLLDLVKFSGFSTVVTADTLTVSGVAWTADQFVTAGPHFVTIRSGSQAGRTLRVIANTTTALTLEVGDTPLNTAGFTVTAGSSAFELYAGKTMGTLFGTTVTNGFLPSGVKAGTSTADADVIYVPSGAVWDSYYFSTTSGSWVLDGNATNQNNLIVYPDDGFLIYRNGAAGSLSMVGRAPSSKLLTQFTGGTSNFVSLRFPASTTLSGLNFGSPGTWITGASDATADTVSVWNSSGYYWQSYFKDPNNQWLEVGGDGSDQSNVTLPRGTAIQIDKKGTGTGSAAFFSQNLPYPL